MKVIQSFGKNVPLSALRLSLCDINREMADAWLEHFYGVDAVEILEGDLLETDADAVVSPANSFGEMYSLPPWLPSPSATKRCIGVRHTDSHILIPT